MLIASVALNEWLAGNSYAGWFAFDYLAHLANTALVALLVARLAAACGRDGRVAGVVAAAFFALCPMLAEGVFWIAARADASVTLLTLAGVYAWSATPSSPMRAALLPAFLALALGFKESAAVFPLQMTLVALAWPMRLSRAQKASVAACFILAALFLALRAHFFGDFWRAYMRPNVALGADELWLGASSIADWWHALTRSTPRSAMAYLGLVAGACVLIAARARGAQRLLAAALLCASGGLVAATLLEVGAMAASGEGGRLAYTPVAWLALAIGVAASRPLPDTHADERHRWHSYAGLALVSCATLIGAWMLHHELRTASAAQRSVRGMVSASREWAAAHPGLTLLLIEENYGPVVTTRNAQAWLVLPPMQPQPLLHRVLPTLPAELGPRYDQLAAGLGARLEEIRPSRLDGAELTRLLAGGSARWPEHYACWSARTGRIVELMTVPDPENRARWTQALRDGFARCAVASRAAGYR